MRIHRYQQEPSVMAPSRQSAMLDSLGAVPEWQVVLHDATGRNPETVFDEFDKEPFAVPALSVDVPAAAELARTAGEQNGSVPGMITVHLTTPSRELPTDNTDRDHQYYTDRHVLEREDKSMVDPRSETPEEFVRRTAIAETHLWLPVDANKLAVVGPNPYVKGMDKALKAGILEAVYWRSHERQQQAAKRAYHYRLARDTAFLGTTVALTGTGVYEMFHEGSLQNCIAFIGGAAVNVGLMAQSDEYKSPNQLTPRMQAVMRNAIAKQAEKASTKLPPMLTAPELPEPEQASDKPSGGTILGAIGKSAAHPTH